MKMVIIAILAALTVGPGLAKAEEPAKCLTLDKVALFHQGRGIVTKNDAIVTGVDLSLIHI